ncbi:MAG: penicillin-binding transpeptidase domain-containing protein [Verrucomicrobiota bacterium]
MLIVDQLRKDDPQLRFLAVVVLGGLCVLLSGLWWVQVIARHDYQANLETQSFRTVRIPAVRGRIMDRNGTALAENRPTYNVSLYLEELRKPFDAASDALVVEGRATLRGQAEQREKALGRSLSKEERKQFSLGVREKNDMRRLARYIVASNVVYQVGRQLQIPLTLDRTDFERHYDTRLALPYPVLRNLEPVQIARFQEQSTSLPGVDIEIQSTRVYPFAGTSAHLVGALRRDDSSTEGEEAFFSYRLPDYRGDLGIEYGFDRYLRGTAGAKSVLVNNIGYRQMEQVWSSVEPGSNIVLTVDMRLQQAAEKAMQSGPHGALTRGAAVVMNVQNGDVLALISSPSLNPNHFIHGFPRGEWQRIIETQAQKNRATQENYAPGSIFKTVVGLAALEAGLNPRATMVVPENPNQRGRGYFVLGHRVIRDTAPPGVYDFKKALKLSSNTYFISHGIQLGPEPIIALGHKFFLGERFGLPTRQETGGYFPDAGRVRGHWTDGNTANLSIGQDPVLVTPLQVAVMMSALANGGTVYWPRLVSRIEPVDTLSGSVPVEFPAGVVRGRLGVRQGSLTALYEAMLADTEDPDGTGSHVRDHANIQGLRICGKTGTAQIMDERNVKTGQTTWFASFAPFEKPKYAVVVMVENGASGGGTCAPIAGKIYQALLEVEKGVALSGALAKAEVVR